MYYFLNTFTKHSKSNYNSSIITVNNCIVNIFLSIKLYFWILSQFIIFYSIIVLFRYSLHITLRSNHNFNYKITTTEMTMKIPSRHSSNTISHFCFTIKVSCHKFHPFHLTANNITSTPLQFTILANN